MEQTSPTNSTAAILDRLFLRRWETMFKTNKGNSTIKAPLCYWLRNGAQTVLLAIEIVAFFIPGIYFFGKVSSECSLTNSSLSSWQRWWWQQCFYRGWHRAKQCSCILGIWDHPPIASHTWGTWGTPPASLMLPLGLWSIAGTHPAGSALTKHMSSAGMSAIRSVIG